jgi:hopanoid biosynthesis associated protein HpnK
LLRFRQVHAGNAQVFQIETRQHYKDGSLAFVRHLIVTADDFGLHESVNEAVEQASRAGVLSAASLMISGPAATDAIARARRLPQLRVGLHLVLADGRGTLPATRLSAIADRDGFMDSGMFSRGVAIFANPRARRQARAEIRAQLEAFRQTGLELDHVNAHKHFHLHPTVLGILLSMAQEFGIRAIRVPREPVWFARARGGQFAAVSAASLAPLAMLMQQRIHSAGLLHNDRVFGIANSGAMDESEMLKVLERLPEGINEIYLHPAVESGQTIAASMATYRHADELAALLSPRVRDALHGAGVKLGGYGDVLKDITASPVVYSDR